MKTNHFLKCLKKINMLGCIAVILAGCMMGPDFHRPKPPKLSRYTETPTLQQTADASVLLGASQHLVIKDIPKQWWQVFHSHALNELIIKAIAKNPDLQAARAALLASKENVAAQKAYFYPFVNGFTNPTRHLTAATLSPIVASNALLYNLTTSALTVSYVPDVFGSNRRQTESLIAVAEAQRFQMEAVYLTLTSNLAMAVIQEASLRAQIRVIKRTISIAERQLGVLTKEQQLGQIGSIDVSQQATVLAQTRALLPPLEEQLAQQRHQIAVLSGEFPSDASLARYELSDFHLPTQLPLILPSQLIRQRPDVRIAEANLHAASADIGVAVAARWPSFTLTADTGSAAIKLATLFSSLTKFWDIGLNATQPLIYAGLLKHRQRAAEATFKQMCAQYRSTVLAAVQDVADTLKSIQYDAEGLKTALAAERTAYNTLQMMEKEWQLGNINYLLVLNAQQAYQQTTMNLVQKQTDRLIDSVALFQALGGSYRNPCCSVEVG